MKKIFTLLSAGALFAASAATLSNTSGTTFAGLTAGDAFSASGAAAEGGKYYWYSADAQSGTNMSLAANYYGGACGRPNQFAEAETSIALAVDAENILYRAAEGSASAFSSPSFTQVDLGDGGLYIDTLIKFEQCRDEADIADDAGKLAVWLNSASNLVITAGKYSGENFSTNDYEISYLDTDACNHLDPDAWYRLTVKAAISNGRLLFTVYIDGKQARSTTGGLTEEFPSLVPEANQLSALAFHGMGAVDDISFTEELPNFLGVAQIGDTYYSTLADAIAAASANDVINLLADPGVDGLVLPTTSGVSISDPNAYLEGKVTAPNGYVVSHSGTTYSLIDNTAATWIGTVGGSWSTGSNWSTGYVPTQYTTVTLPDGAAITVTGTSALPVNNLIVNGNATVTCAGDLANNWPSIGIDGNVTGTGTLKIERAGLKSLGGDLVTVDSNIYFDGKDYDCFVESGSFVFNGSFSGTNRLDILTATTFNGTVTVPDGAILRIGKNSAYYPTVSFGGSATLKGDGTVVIWSNNYDAGTATELASIKAKLKASDWKGVCELSGTMKNIDFGQFGNSESVVRANGLSGFLRFSIGGTTEIATGILALDIGSNGLAMNNQFSSGSATSYIFGADLTGTGTIAFGTKHQQEAYSLYTFTGDVSGFTGAINYGTLTSYRAVVVFRTSEEPDPTPTDYGQIIVTVGKTVNVHGTWYGAGGFLIYGTVNMASGANLTCDSEGQKICGDGVIRYAALPSNALSFGDWTGTAIIDYVGPSERIDLAASVNKIGLAGSTVEIAESCTIPGNSYLNANLNPTLKVSGFVSINDGSSATKRTIPNLTGDGVLVFGSKGAMVNYAVNNVVDWGGVITNASSATLVTNLVSGTGKVVYAVAAAATTINAGFGGEVEYDVSPSFAPIVNAESEATVYLNFNYAGMAIAPYGSTKSTIKLGNLSAENAYFNDSNGSGTGLVPSKVVVAGNVTMNNGWTQTDAFWDNAKTMKFEDFTVDGSFSLIASSARTWGTARSYYYIKSLNGDGSGSITVGQGYSLRIDAVDFAEAPSGTGCIVPLTLTDGPNLSTDGQLHGVNGVLNGTIPVTVNGVANGQMLTYDAAKGGLVLKGRRKGVMISVY